MNSLRGKLLIASPTLLDPSFRRSVVLVAEHDEDGAMGVVLTRPGEASVAEAVPELAPLAGGEDAVYVGGPVDPEALVVLAEFEDPAEAATLVVGRVGFLPADALAGPPRIGRARVFAGYAGWGAGQLEAELAQQAWIVEAATPDDVFAAPAELWSAVLRRKGGSFAVIALMPNDPSLN